MKSNRITFNVYRATGLTACYFHLVKNHDTVLANTVNNITAQTIIAADELELNFELNKSTCIFINVRDSLLKDITHYDPILGNSLINKVKAHLFFKYNDNASI